MSQISFKITHRDKKSKARTGVIKTLHGDIETPSFVPVGTQATVKAVSPRDLREMGAQIVLANTYHLHLRPGENLIKKMGGLAKFMSWNGPTMTDSGGFQVFSLGVGKEGGGVKFLKDEPKTRDPEEAHPRLNKISEEGVIFQSHIDGSTHLLSPETSIKIQEKIGADLVVAFDDLESPKYSHDKTKSSLGLTNRWLIRSKKAHKNPSQLLYGVTHGGRFRDLRELSAKFVDENFNAIGMGGAHLSKQNLYDVVDWTTDIVADEKPRHLLGIGEVDDVFEIIERGVDTFDCVIPTRLGRTGFFFISPPFGNIRNRFRTDIDKPIFRQDSKPLDENCNCFTCQNFSRAYISHLFRSRELLAYQVISIHNVHFLINLTRQIRESIINNNFSGLKKKWLL
jgi:tRNA-guanine transglycosylase